VSNKKEKKKKLQSGKRRDSKRAKLTKMVLLSRFVFQRDGMI